MGKPHNIQEITRYQFIEASSKDNADQSNNNPIRNHHTLFLSRITYTQDDSISTKLSKYSSSEILSDCLKEKAENHAWSLHEIETNLYSNTGAHFNSYFQDWFQKKYQHNILRTNVEYANAIFVDRDQVNYDKISFYTPMNQFFEDCHPILQKKLLELDINTISIQQFIRNGRSQKHILIDGQLIDGNTIKFEQEDKQQLKNRNHNEIVDGLFGQFIQMYPNGKSKNQEEPLIDRLTCNIIYILGTEELIYIDDIDLWSIGEPTHQLNYIKKDESIENASSRIKYVYAQDYIKGKNASKIIKNNIISKAAINKVSKISEDDEIIDVVGQNFFNGAKTYISQHVEIGDEVTLVLDKTNIYDRYAILVLHNGKGLGYISSKRNFDINFYMLQNKNLKTFVFALDKEGRSTVQIIIKHVKKLIDKEPPSSKYEKYIYELPLNVAVTRMKTYFATFEETSSFQQGRQIELILLSGLYRLYQELIPYDGRFFQPLVKTTLYQIFGPKSIYDLSELIQSNKLTDDELDTLIHSSGRDNQLSLTWKKLVEITKQNKDFRIEIVLNIYVDYLSTVLDTIIISKKKYGNEYNLLHNQIHDIECELKKLLLQE